MNDVLLLAALYACYLLCINNVGDNVEIHITNATLHNTTE